MRKCCRPNFCNQNDDTKIVVYATDKEDVVCYKIYNLYRQVHSEALVPTCHRIAR
jgi:hypothetical protein